VRNQNIPLSMAFIVTKAVHDKPMSYKLPWLTDNYLYPSRKDIESGVFFIPHEKLD